MRICLDIFEELGLIAVEDGETTARRLPAKRVDLQSSVTLRTITDRAKEGSSNG